MILSNNQIAQILNNCEASEAYRFLAQTLDARINEFRIDYLKKWEANHETPFDPFNAKIKEFELQKVRLKAEILEPVEQRPDSMIQFGENDNSHAKMMTY